MKRAKGSVLTVVRAPEAGVDSARDENALWTKGKRKLEPDVLGHGQDAGAWTVLVG